MMTTATVEDLRLRVQIGIYDWEMEGKQDVFLTYSIKYDSGRSADSLDINDTVNYCDITMNIARAVEEHGDFVLVEKLLDFVLDIIMSYAGVLEADITLCKPAAMRKIAQNVKVNIHCTREEYNKRKGR